MVCASREAQQNPVAAIARMAVLALLVASAIPVAAEPDDDLVSIPAGPIAPSTLGPTGAPGMDAEPTNPPPVAGGPALPLIENADPQVGRAPGDVHTPLQVDEPSLAPRGTEPLQDSVRPASITNPREPGEGLVAPIHGPANRLVEVPQSSSTPQVHMLSFTDLDVAAVPPSLATPLGEDAGAVQDDKPPRARSLDSIRSGVAPAEQQQADHEQEEDAFASGPEQSSVLPVAPWPQAPGTTPDPEPAPEAVSVQPSEASSVLAALLAAAGAAAAWYIVTFFAPLLASRKKDPLAHEARRALFATVQSRPGCHLRELAQRTGLAKGQATHHLKVLVASGHLVRMNIGGFACFFPDDQSAEAFGAASAVLRSKRACRLLDYVNHHPGCTVAEAEQHEGVPKRGFHYHSRRLSQVGLIEVATHGGTRFLDPTPSGIEAASLLTGQASATVPSIDMEHNPVAQHA